uniref:Uncharacterized protein n=1 Tax=Romanomermis culicivorax TaxID=13658 RepID=A0A915ISF5_ROMCU
MQLFSRLSNQSTRFFSSKSLDYCVDLVKKSDNESYLCCLLLPNRIRHQAFIIKALNCELSTLRDQTKNQRAGLGRLEFWSKIVENAFKFDQNLLHHPVADCLYWMIKNESRRSEIHFDLNLNRTLFLDLISARRKIVSEYEPRIASYADLEDQGTKTFGSCNRLILNLLNIEDQLSHDLASEAGQSLAIINLLRSFNPTLIKKNAVILPDDLFGKFSGSSKRTILRTKFKNNEQLTQICRFLASKAEEKLNRVRSNINENRRHLKKELYSVLIFTTIIDYYLALLKKSDYNLYDRRLQLKNHYLPWSLWWNKIKRKV